MLIIGFSLVFHPLGSHRFFFCISSTGMSVKLVREGSVLNLDWTGTIPNLDRPFAAIKGELVQSNSLLVRALSKTEPLILPMYSSDLDYPQSKEDDTNPAPYR